MLAYAREGLMHVRARRQALAREAAISAARKAQVVWQYYGEQPPPFNSTGSLASGSS